MKREFKWKNFARVWRNVVRVLRNGRSRRKRKKLNAANTTFTQTARQTEELRFSGDAPSYRVGKRECVDVVNKGEIITCETPQAKETTFSSNVEKDAEIGPNATKRAENSTKSAFPKTEIKKTKAEETQPIEIKENKIRVETRATAKGAVVDEGGPSVASLRSTDRATLKDGTQDQSAQGIRAWLNDKGKIVVKAALEVELSSRSTEFAFFRSARGTLYRYPLRRLSLADRAWIRETLALHLANESVVDDFGKGEKSVSSVGASEDVTLTEVASERAVVSRGNVNGARGNNGELICAEEEGKEENETFANDDGNDLDLSDFDEQETSQTLLEQELNEESDEDLRLDFWAETEKDATSLNESEEGRSKEGKRDEDDEGSDDLRLNFWAGENDIDDVSTKKNKSLDKMSQPAKNNGLRKNVERKQGARLNVEIPSHNLSTRRRRQQGEEDSGRKNEKKRKKTTLCHTEYYELFSRMEAAELDGTLYDYLDSFDSIRDEIETECIIDYYDWTYGDARYRGEGGEFE